MRLSLHRTTLQLFIFLSCSMGRYYRRLLYTVNATDPVLSWQLPMIRQIIADETWLEGERRGCWVSSSDPVVKENVCRIILRIGAQLRAAAERSAFREATIATSGNTPFVIAAIDQRAA